MKNFTYSIRFLILIIGLIFSFNSFSQTDTNVQHIQNDVGRNGSSTSGFTAVSSLNNAFTLANNNRKSNAGRSDLTVANLAGRDVSGARRLTGTNTLSYYRDNNSLNTDMRFSSSIWEYEGTPGGPNEFIVRGRYLVTLNGGTNNVTTPLTGITNANKCIPFITGILNNSAGSDADSGTAIAYLENASTLRVQKGSNANNVTVYITIVEFTGSNWILHHGDVSSANDTGAITLKSNSNGTGATTSVNAWNNAVIFTQHRGDMSDNGANEGLDDNWPLTKPGGSLSTVDWEFDGGHSGNARQFVHVLENADLNVTRYQDTSNSDGETTINISSAGLTNINQALVVGTSITNGGGTAYGRGWRNYYLKSTTQAAHWSHRSGNNMQHEIQIVDLSGLTTNTNCTTLINTFPYTESFEAGIGDWGQATNNINDDIDWERDSGGTPSSNTGPAGASDGNWYMFTESSNPNYFKTAILESPCFNLNTISYPEFSFAYHMYGANMGDLYVDISTDNGANYINIWNQLGQAQTSHNDSWETVSLFLGAYVGEYVKLRFRGFTGNGYRSDMAIDDIRLVNIIPIPEISVRGKDNREIVNGDLIPDYIDDTNFGIINLGSTLERTFTIDNSAGSGDLDITNITLSNTTDFAITGTPYSTPVGSGSSTTFSVTYTAATTGTQSSTVTIYNNDSDEYEYVFEIQGSAVQYFYDSDGDNILDNLDVDDDNDGIPDTTEESNCGVVGGTIVNYKFLNETFGAGTGRSTINTNNYAATTTYCFEDGIVGPNSAECPFQSSWILDDGEYCVVSKITGTAANDPENIHGDLAWYNGEDHTPGDTNGRMAVFNASFSPGVFYETTITGVLSNLPVTYSFWALNIMAQNTFPGSILPDITVQFLDLDGNLLSTFNTNPFGRCTASTTDNSCSQGEWHQYSTSVNLGNTNSFIVRFINDAPGGGGNDLAIDDIVIAQTLCDTDGDGIADVFDLDSDNDGIPDVVEAGMGDWSNGTAQIYGWDDSNNNNGMHDAAEGFLILDSDGDTIPNYIDLDSDNDTIFDVDESKVGNPANFSFENGDGDINGDGVGDGLDTDYVRQQDFDSDGLTELFADGILDIYDYYNGTTFNSAYGNENQGLGSTYYVLDSDNDGLPDYIDITSNGISYDINQTLYANLDSNNNGRIGGLNYIADSDKDGILDAFDTDDNRFGSPRDLDRKLDLYFDGRNDYIEDSELLSGRTNATIMGWIKIDPTFTSGEGVLFGQNNLEIAVKSASGNYYISAIANEKTATNDLGTHPINANQWYHVTAAFDGSVAEITLYINGERLTTAENTGGTLSNNTDKLTIGKEANNNSKYFKGFIDEVRVFNKTLSDNEIQKMVYQEIENNSGTIRGSVVPKDITDFISPNSINPLDWPSLLRYYRMDVYKDDIIDDLTTPGYDTGTGAKLYNAKLIDYQTAPMPFVTQSSGDLTDAVDIAVDGVNGDDAATYDWSIVRVKHNDVSYSGHQGHLGLFIDELDASSTPIEYKVNNDSELNVSWYLELNGFIDLEGESQLVQGHESDLVVGTNGKIEKDQQGTQDLYTYNYWSSPVGFASTPSTINNYEFNLNNHILKDGTDSDSPINISFVGGYDGSNSGASIEIAHYWIWKYQNQISDNYPSWQHVRNTGKLLAGEGFTMKGVANTNGAVSLEQNYVFDGKPNNGEVTLEIFGGNDYLVGNPYASAIDAEQFITDNGPIISGGTGEIGEDPLISGTLYFWEHWGGGSHITREYQGGYGTYNYSGGLPAAAHGQSDPDVSQVGTGTKTPGRYIPVGQGFFVTGESDGFINFNNGQRKFQKEGTAASVFMRNSENNTNSNAELDERMKIRLGFNSVNTIHRQLLVTADDRASADYDWGFDAKLNEEQMDDMYWIINDGNYIIQGIDTFSESTILPLGIKTRDDGLNNITIDLLENVPNDMGIFAHDKDLNIYHDLRESNYEIFLEAGEYLDRFEITFTNQSLSVDEFDDGDVLQVFYVNSKGSIVIQNPKLVDLKSAEMFNVLGQSIARFNNIETKNYLELKTNALSTGTYILNLKTTDGAVITKKVLVK